MYNKLFQIILGICTLGLVACAQSSTNGSTQTNVTITDDSITIFNDSKPSFNLQIKVGNEVSFTKDVKTNQKNSLLSLLKTNKDSYNDIALLLAKNNGEVSLNLSISEVLDTTINYHLDIKDASQYSTKVLQGNCANLSGNFDAANVEGDIIKWLYRKNQKNVGDDVINNMRMYLQELNRTNFKEYITKEAIPVVTSFQGISYKVASDLVADNYYLFACKTEKELEDFVEEIVSIKFDGAVHSLSQPISCYRGASTSGTICIFLVGIDNDWNYRIAPVGLVCIDNIKPSQMPSNNSGSSDIVFNKNKVKINMPKNVPSITGYASLGTRNWGGNGVSCNVNFIVSFGGDVKTLTLVREGHLAKWLSKGTKVIDLQAETSPYIFTYELHLEDGDNYIPVIITDSRGNTTKFKYNVPAEFTRNNAPQINIDNNVNVFD